MKSSQRKRGPEKKRQRIQKTKMDATEYLLSNPVNAEYLRRAIAAAKRGELISHDLIEPGSAREPRKR